MRFNEVLMSRRKQLGMTQDELAEKLEVSRQSISKWENGECMPESEKLIKLADILDIGLDELVGREARAAGSAGEPSAPIRDAPAPAPATAPKKRLLRALLIAALCLLILPLCVLGMMFLFAAKGPASGGAKSKLPDELTVSGISIRPIARIVEYNEEGETYEKREWDGYEISFVPNYTYTGEDDVSCAVYYRSDNEAAVSVPAVYDGGTFRVKLDIGEDEIVFCYDVVFTVKSGDYEKSASIAKRFSRYADKTIKWIDANGEAHDF